MVGGPESIMGNIYWCLFASGLIKMALQCFQLQCLSSVSLIRRYGEALFMNSKLISGVTEFLNTEAELSEVSLDLYTILRLLHLHSI